MMIDETLVAGHLQRLGYLEQSDVAGATHDGLESAVRSFQRRFGLAETGRADDATRTFMARPRCGVADPPVGARVFGAGDAWQKQTLTWSIIEPSDKLPPHRDSNALRWALNLWEAVTSLDFKWVRDDANADIVVRFVTGAHGDHQAMDGPGNLLAHAFFPPPLVVGDGPAGDVHFDETEAWTVRMPMAGNEQDLVTVALHEIGHSLGLVHSFEPDDVMFPTIGGAHRYLSENDVFRIQGLHGNPHDGQGEPFDGNRDSALWFSDDDQLNVFAVTTVGGRHIRRLVDGAWQQWRELGGE